MQLSCTELFTLFARVGKQGDEFQLQAAYKTCLWVMLTAITENQLLNNNVQEIYSIELFWIT